MQGGRHQPGPDLSGDLQVLDAGLDPPHVSDLLCAELGHVAARTAAAMLKPTAELRIPCVAGEDGQHAEMRAVT
jgi:hypothetical protein